MKLESLNRPLCIVNTAKNERQQNNLIDVVLFCLEDVIGRKMGRESIEGGWGRNFKMNEGLFFLSITYG